MSAMVKLTGEMEVQTSDVIRYGMVSNSVTFSCNTHIRDFKVAHELEEVDKQKKILLWQDVEMANVPGATKNLC